MTLVRDIMRDDVITVAPDTSVREIAQTLVRESIGGVPVVESDGTVVGVVSASDIVRATARDPEVELGFEVERTPELEVDETLDEELAQLKARMGNETRPSADAAGAEKAPGQEQNRPDQSANG